MKVKLSDYGYSILQIETYGACNMKCQFCPYPVRIDNTSRLDKEMVIKSINAIDSSDPAFEYMTLSQFNEPLMDPNIYQYYKYMREAGIPVLAITNGVLLSSKDVRFNFIESEPSAVKISLQTINEEKFKVQRGIGMSAQRYFKGVAKYLKEVDTSSTKVTLDLACNFTSRRRKIFHKILGLSSGEMSVEQSPVVMREDLLRFIDLIKTLDSRVVVSENQIDQFLENSDNSNNSATLVLRDGIEMKIKPFIFGRRISEFREYKGPIRCGNRILGILADGSVVPCCLAYDNSLSLGNIYEESLYQILEKNKDWLKDLRDFSQLRSPVCRSCLGEPTERGVFLKQFHTHASELKRKIKAKIALKR